MLGTGVSTLFEVYERPRLAMRQQSWHGFRVAASRFGERVVHQRATEEVYWRHRYGQKSGPVPSQFAGKS